MQVRRASGFGLLEALVALTILAASGAALFTWLNQSLQMASRLKVRQAEVEQQLLAENLLADLNPFVEPSGERTLGGVKLSWQSQMVSPMRPSQPTRATQSPRWRVGLYRVQVVATNLDGTIRNQFAYLQPGLELLAPATQSRRPDEP
ncbi:PulJ/GspJ family protein [Paucibacter sp. PLA-PC-4]|uniref:PulJ/GspJ family protein n=1 Tax=Paucibacter sp. PLA-PC-4 TaxID=2993655 RepID=UPI003A4C5ED2